MGSKYHIVACMLVLAAAPCAAQQYQAEIHANYDRTTQSKQSAWGAGAQIQETWGMLTLPAKLGTSIGVDYLQQENGGPTSKSLGLDLTLQPGGSGTITPYAGGSVSENWLSGGGATGTHVGFEYIVGVQVKLEAQGPLSFKLEVRPGYVETQEHSITGRFGVAMSF